ncbi:MAG: hypothetical protein RI560_10065 [Natronomonas sp.]|uniref:DUF7535 family protein n=1 Tax=Natronomonas sp. TaxID=2184060 RepID=UPI00286FFEB7|nr:hypothetical protein [Natronomonas sp.]MDR9381997.1 hypothetical protein [Natronomonas sp.]MDR9431638.1 hypothetical protein [Natronomonas sp.]
MSDTDNESLIRTVTPITPKETSIGNKILDAAIGIGALILLLPLAPFLLALWLWDRLQRDEPGNEA